MNAPTLLTYCHGSDMERCADCQHGNTWADLHQLPAGQRDGLVRDALMVNREHCRMNGGAFYAAAAEVTA